MSQSPFTSTEQQNAQRTFLHETAVNYQNEADVIQMAQDWTETPINDIGIKVPLELSLTRLSRSLTLTAVRHRKSEHATSTT